MRRPSIIIRLKIDVDLDHRHCHYHPAFWRVLVASTHTLTRDCTLWCKTTFVSIYGVLKIFIPLCLVDRFTVPKWEQTLKCSDIPCRVPSPPHPILEQNTEHVARSIDFRYYLWLQCTQLAVVRVHVLSHLSLLVGSCAQVCGRVMW